MKTTKTPEQVNRGMQNVLLDGPVITGGKERDQVAEPSAFQMNRQVDAGQLFAQSKPNLMDIFSDEDDSDDHDYVLATDRQQFAVQRVLSQRDGDHYEILGIREGSSDAVILHAFAEMGKAVHPYFNLEEKAADAYRRVVRAAKALGVSRANIEAMKKYDEDEDEFRTLHEGVWIDWRLG